MNGVAGRLKAYFYRTDKAFVAVSLSNAGCRLEKYICFENCWQLEEESILSAAGGTYGQQEMVDFEAAVEQAAMEISRKGWQGIPLLYIVPEFEQMRYALNLPPGLTDVQQREAAYWELDDQLLAQGLSAENFACVCCMNDEAGGGCIITGVSKEYLRGIEEVFARAELDLADIVPAPGVLDYLSSSHRELAGFKKRPGTGLAAGRLLAVWLIFWLTAGIALLSADLFHYWQAESLAEKQQNELAMLAAEEREMQELTTMAANIAAREKKVQLLGQQGMPWYSFLVHLGVNTIPGVSLTGINASVDEHKLRLAGQAVNYDCLAEFVGRCEADKAFFMQGITLEDSTVNKGSGGEPDKVNFSVSVNWESENGQIPEKDSNMQ